MLRIATSAGVVASWLGCAQVPVATTAVPGDGDERPVVGDGDLVRFRFPTQIAYADFDLGSGEALDSLTAVSVVPTADIWLPVGERWTVIPFVGLGGGWLIEEDVAIAILTAGARALWVHHLNEPTQIRVQPRVQYDLNMNRPDGILGDWGRLDLSAEIRYAFGSPGDRYRLEAGVYVQGFYYWDDIDFELPAVTPDSVETQAEVGVSLGLREPFEVFGLDLSRVYLGVRVGDGVDFVGLRFGEL